MTEARGIPIVAPTGSGLLIDGVEVKVPDVPVVNMHDASWAHLSREDGMPRSHRAQFLILHKTKADDPEHVMPGAGVITDEARRVVEYWQDDPKPSAAQIVVSWDYAVCICDVAKTIAWNARAANYLGIGIEHYEELGGTVYDQTLHNGFLIERVLCARVGIQYQVPRLPWHGPLKRFADGGRTLVGLFGHRDVDETRNQWDPGDAIFAMHIAAGAEVFDFDKDEDLETWKERQAWLNTRGHTLTIDGIPGPKTTAALKLEGYRDGIWAFGKA